ncbi:BolA family protein [Idiomarina xiamenensis]|uniref:Transcriptional regulator n=1 Tax=Idiomarina xiamenensis 10-D-4 TaxID=740709 RepID=K2JPD8_9GAMM|nr:BolA family protein [Idiomarina xiamenensis]EKE85366.1 transcriptional regulator [Idiomarina xiamenensis 10-D-4]
MEAKDIEALLQAELDLSEVHVKSEGSHAEIIAVGDIFEALSRVKKQQLIYKPLNQVIADGSLHAVSIKAFTPSEWQREKKLIMPS